MSTKLPVTRPRYLAAASMLCLAALPAMHAQTDQPTAAPAVADTEETYLLSPFVVDSSEDKGSYQATSTLAGTRLRTELKDVGSAISVVTSQFLQDTGAKNNQDLLVYTAGTEVGGVSGNFAGTGNGRQLGEASQLLRPNSNTRVRGLTAADNTRDFFLTDIPWDGYNIGRIDMQRGANSILFGMGSPAGIINSSTDQASFKNEGKLEMRYDSQGSVRGSVNINQVLLKDELAIRFAAMADRTRYRQQPAYNDDDRIYGALRYDPAVLKKNGMSTSFRANFEHGSVDANRPRSLTPGDQITPWFNDLDQQVYNPLAEWAAGGNQQAGANYNPLIGAYGNVYGNVISIYNHGATSQSQFRTLENNTNVWGLASNGSIDGGIAGVPFSRQLGVTTYANYMTNSGAPYADLNAYKDNRLGDNDTGLFDYYNQLLDGNNKREWQGFESANFALSQTFLDNRIGLEAVVDKQKYHDGQVNGVNQVIYVDINTNYTDGTANPNVGQAFVQSDNGGSERTTERTAKRFTAFGEFRATDVLDRGMLASIIGRHTLTGMYADEEKKATNLSFVRYAMTDDFADALYSGKNYKIDSNERAVTTISYLSGDLRGLSSSSQANLRRVPDNQQPQATGSLYYFDSHWNRSTDATSANYVDPAAAWIPGQYQEGQYQADNPANYKGWGTYPVSNFWSYDNAADKERLYNSGIKEYYKVKSQAFIWQGYMFDELLVPTVGWRRDEFRGGNSQAPENTSGQVLFHDLDNPWTYNTTPFSAGESLSYSLVAHTPMFIKKHLPLGLGFSVFYNRSKNFQPSPGDVDMFGDPLANPMGRTKDYGFIVNAFDERMSLKVNWYETNVQNARLSGFEFWRVAQWASILATNATRIRDKDPANDWKWSAANTGGTATQAQFDAASAAVFDAYQNNPVFRKFMDGWGLADNLVTEQPSSADTPAGIAATADTKSRGLEFELAARPTPNWNVSINASKTHATQTNIGGALKDWIEAVEGLATGPAGDMRVWWAGDASTMRTFWNQNVASQYKLLKLLEGSDVPELRPWRFNFVSNYNFDHGVLKGVNVGGSYRWEDRVVVGFPIKSQVNSSTGATEYVYDVSNPYRGPREDHVDLWLGYGRKLTSKIDWRVQLNVRNVFAKKELIPVSVQPDGTPAAYRIPELTSWQITNTFSF